MKNRKILLTLSEMHSIVWAYKGIALQNLCTLRKCYLLRLVNKAYHISVVFSTVILKKGGVVLYKKFADLLEKSNKTSYQVSKETGIAQSVLSDWKNGRSKPKFDKLLIRECRTFWILGVWWCAPVHPAEWILRKPEHVHRNESHPDDWPEAG